MATTCDVCGIKTNEVKSGGGIEPKGVKIEVDVRSKEDFSRDVLKVSLQKYIWKYFILFYNIFSVN